MNPFYTQIFPPIPPTMLAVQYQDYSQDPSDLQLIRINKPPPPMGDQVLIRILYAGMNMIDNYLFRGVLKNAGWAVDFPFIPGHDFSGIIEEVGDQVRNFRVGDEVFGCNWDQGRPFSKNNKNIDTMGCCFSEYMLIASEKVSHKPASVSFPQAASISVVGSIAYQCVHDIGLVNKHSRVLIIGGSTCVGMLALQLCKLVGACVTVTCSREGTEALRKYNPDVIVNYDEENIFKLSHCREYDLVIDIIGDPETLYMIKETPYFVCFGSAYVNLINPAVGVVAQAHPPFAYARFYCFHQNTKHQDLLIEMLANHELELPIAEIFSFSRKEVIEMFDRMHRRRHKGKFVLQVASST